MKKLYKIIPFILIFTLLFSTVSFGATGSTNSFMSGFPMDADNGLYSETSTPYFYSFCPDIDSLLRHIIERYAKLWEFEIDIDDMEYMLSYSTYDRLYLVFWDKSAPPDIEFNILDYCNQLVFTPSITSARDDEFRFGFVEMFCNEDSDRITIKAGSYTVPFVRDVYAWSDEYDYNYAYRINNRGWYTKTYPIAQKGANLPFSCYGQNSQLFASNVDVPIPNPDDNITIPDIPEDTDINFSTLIQAIGSFFSQLINKITSLFSNLISKIKEFLSDLLGGISELFSNLQGFLSGVLNNIVTGISNLFSKVSDIYKYLTDTNVDTDYFFESNFYHFVEQILNFRNMFVFSDVSVSDSVSFELDFTKSDSFLSSVGVVLISFDWYLPYRSVVSTLLLVFVYVGLAFRFFKELPSLISGNSGEESGS